MSPKCDRTRDPGSRRKPPVVGGNRLTLALVVAVTLAVAVIVSATLLRRGEDLTPEVATKTAPGPVVERGGADVESPDPALPARHQADLNGDDPAEPSTETEPAENLATVADPLAYPVPDETTAQRGISTADGLPITPDTVTEALIRELEAERLEAPNDDLARVRAAAAYAAMGEGLLTKGEHQRALTYLRQALAREPGNDGLLIAIAAAHLHRGRPGEARRILREVKEAGRETMGFRVLLGDVLYANEELEEALAEYLRAYAMEPREEVRARIDRLRREVGSATDRSLESRHFEVHFNGGENIAIGRKVLDAMERAYDELAPRFGLRSVQVSAVLYSAEDYRRVTGAPHWAAAIYDGKIRVPIGGLRAVDREFRRLLKHEMTHAFVTRKGGVRVPRWVHEGLAQYYDGSHFRDLRLDPEDRERVRSPREPSDPRLFYAQALWRIEYLMERYRAPKMMAILDEMADGGTFEEALESRTRIRYPIFLEQYASWSASD